MKYILKIKSPLGRFAAALVPVAMTFGAGTAVAQTELPSMKFMTAPLVEPGVALGMLDQSTRTSNVPVTGRPAEIKELAVGLGKDRLSAADYIQRVHEYVYNNVRVSFVFGLQKGAYGALTDQYGTPFDQAALMIELLREKSGLTANYEPGTISLSATQAGNWFGTTSAPAICRMLADGGIPATVNGSGNASCNMTGSVTGVTMLHVWVAANGGRFDPSFKVNTVKTGIDLPSALQCGAAGSCTGTLAALRTAATSAALTGANQTNITGATNAIRSVSQTSLESQLRTWSMNLKAKIDTITTPEPDLASIIGGAQIDAGSRPTATTLPYGATAATTWTEVPNGYRTSVRVQFDTIDKFLFADEIAGKRLRMFTSVWTNGSPQTTRFARLDLEGASIGSSTRVDGTPSNGMMTLTINHPYAASAGTYMDEAVQNNWAWALSGAPPGFSEPDIQSGYLIGTIVLAFGDTGQSAVTHMTRLSQNDVYGANGSNNTINPGFCQPYSAPETFGYVQQTGAMPGYSGCTQSQHPQQITQWLAQRTTAGELIGSVNNSLISHHHSVGLLLVLKGGGTFLNVESSVSATSKANSSSDRRATVYSYAHLSSRLEGAAIEQLTGVWEGGSTPSLAARFNALGYRAANFATASGFASSPAYAAYAASNPLFPHFAPASSTINSYLNAGYQVTLVDRSSSTSNPVFPALKYSPSSPTGPTVSQSISNPILAVRPSASDASTPDRISHLVNSAFQFIGKGASPTAVDDPMKRTMESVKLADASMKSQKYYGVDSSYGTFRLTPPADLITGDGDFPRSLAFQRQYSSSNSGLADSISVPWFYDSRDCSVFPPSTPTIPWCSSYVASQRSPSSSYIGGGWDHALNVRASISSEAFQGMGEDSPADAVGSIASLVALRALSSTAPGFVETTASMYVSNWFGSNLRDNAVVVARPPKNSVFVRLPDGTFNAPNDASAEALTQTGLPAGPYAKQPDISPQFQVAYDYSPVTYSLREAGGSTLAFVIAQGDVHPGDTIGFKQFRATEWAFPSGHLVSFAYDQTTQPHCLRTVSNTLGRTLTFDYEQPQFTGATGGSAARAPYGQCYLKSVTDENGRIVSLTRPGATNLAGQTGASAYFGGLFRMPELRVQLADSTTVRYLYTDNTLLPGSIPRVHSAIQSVILPSTTAPYISLGYDTMFRVSQLTDAQARSIRYFIGGITPLESLHRGENVDALNAVGTHFFGRFGEELQTIDPLGRVTSKLYDAKQRLLRITLPEGNYTENDYDVRNNIIQVRRVAKQGSGLTTTSTSTTFTEAASSRACVNPVTCNLPVSTTDARNAVTNYTFSATTGQLLTVTHPSVPLTSSTTGTPKTRLCYTSFTVGGRALSLLTGRIERITSSVDRVNRYAYSSANRYALSSGTVDPATTLLMPSSDTQLTCSTASKSGAQNLTTAFTFDGVGNVSSIDGPRSDVSDVTNFRFDALRRLTRVVAPLNSITRYTYDTDGQLRTTRRNLVSAPTDSNPSNPRPTDLVTAHWSSESRDYFANGALRSITDPEGNVVRHEYDLVGHQVMTIDPDNRRTASVFDAAGQKLCTWGGWDSATAPTSCGWDPATYVSAGYRGKIREVEFTYTPNGKRRSLQDAVNNVTDFVYDGFDRLAFTLFPHPTTGNRCTVTSPVTSSTTPTCSGGSLQTYERVTYDENDNRRTLRTRKNEVTTWTYDALNRAATKSAVGLPLVTSYHNLVNDRIEVSSPAATGFPAHRVSYGYDEAGRKTYEENLLNGTARRVSYQYNGANNRTRTTWPDGYFVHYAFDALGRMEFVRENSTTANEIARYRYDVLSRREELRFAGIDANRMGYMYEADNSLDLLTQVLNSASFTLDYGRNASAQVTSLVSTDDFYLPSPSAATSAYVPDRLNRYSNVAGNPATYDLNGNLLTWGPSSTLNTYTYDSENRLRTASVTGGASATYDYDGVGRRLSKTVGGASTFFLLDGDEEVGEYDSSGTLLLRRFISGAAVDDRIATAEGSATTTPTKTYYHVNHQGSVIAMTDSAGNAIGCAAGVNCQRLNYDAYGNLGSGSVATGQPYRYTGRRFDSETGLYYYRARYYSPVIGRFLQTDPIGYEGGFNLYAYVGNDPLNKTDPTGENEYVLVWKPGADGIGHVATGTEDRDAKGNPTGTITMRHLWPENPVGKGREAPADYRIEKVNKDEIANFQGGEGRGADGIIRIAGDAKQDAAVSNALVNGMKNDTYSVKKDAANHCSTYAKAAIEATGIKVDQTGKVSTTVAMVPVSEDGHVTPVAVYNSVVNSGDARVEVVKEIPESDRDPNLVIPR